MSGKKEKSGRKPIDKQGAMESHSVTMPSRFWSAVETAGNGNRSMGMRIVVDFWNSHFQNTRGQNHGK